MRWRTASSYHAVSDCGHYSISHAQIESGRCYDAWSGKLDRGDLRHLYSGPDKSQAIRACEDDAKRRAQAKSAAAQPTT